MHEGSALVANAPPLESVQSCLHLLGHVAINTQAAAVRLSEAGDPGRVMPRTRSSSCSCWLWVARPRMRSPVATGPAQRATDSFLKHSRRVALNYHDVGCRKWRTRIMPIR